MTDIYKMLTKTSELVNDSGFITGIAHNSTTSIQGGTTNEYYHLTSARHSTLTTWMDYVTLGADGSLVLPSGAALTITDRIRLNFTSGAIGFYDIVHSNWGNYITASSGILTTSANFYMTGYGNASTLTTRDGVVTGASSTSLSIGGTIAGALHINSAPTVSSAIYLKSGETAAQVFAFNDTGWTAMKILAGGIYNIDVFGDSIEGRNKTFSVYGFPTGGAKRYMSQQIILNYARFDTDAPSGFDFNGKAVGNIATLAVTTSGTINSNAIATVATKLDDFGATDDNTDLDATTAKHGLMPKADKVKLDGIATGALAVGYTLQAYVTTAWNATQNQVVYFGSIGRAPSTTEGYARVYIPKSGTIKRADVWSYALTNQGTGEAWVANIRLNGSTSTLIQSIEVADRARHWVNDSMSLSVSAGDYFEIELDAPDTWSQAPTGLYSSAVVYIE